MTIRVVLGLRAPTRRLGVGASMSVERGCGPESRHRAAGARLRAVTVVAWHATVICQAFRRDLDARAPRRTPLSTTRGLRDDASKRVRVIASQVRRLTRSVTACSLTRCCGGALESCPEATTGNALCMHWVRCGGCAVGHRRDTSTYACGNPASTRFSRPARVIRKPAIAQ